ncbi:hypothetical protein [Deinococcus rufus]|uniref:Uncharacterized protein n=1 Tax=Deinococcus rufus TaxID=2136097 RepID=A0ABV7ZDQ1_9DEIO
MAEDDEALLDTAENLVSTGMIRVRTCRCEDVPMGDSSTLTVITRSVSP